MKADSEKYLESSLVAGAHKAGSIAIKMTSQFHRGLPDRLLILRDGKVRWVELKTTGKKPTPIQERMHKRLKAYGHRVDVVDTKADLDRILEELSNEI